MNVVSKRGLLTCSASVVDLGPRGHIATGLPFLDHMIDQLTAHGQLGVSVSVEAEAANANGKRGRTTFAGEADYAGGSRTDRPHDADIFEAAGAALGAALKPLLERRPSAGVEVARRFLAPLDEALAEVVIECGQSAKLGLDYSQAPFGTNPPTGREWIGNCRTALFGSFWRELVEASGIGALRLRKLRGVNAHHIVESSFKAFARCLRSVLDAEADGAGPAPTLGAPANIAPGTRAASTSRQTKETAISFALDLDCAPPPPPEVAAGLASLDRMLDTLAAAARIQLVARY